MEHFRGGDESMWSLHPSMWWEHEHVYRGPDKTEYTFILGEPITQYNCKCGLKIKVFADGEILKIWKDGENPVYDGSVIALDGKISLKYVSDFDLNKIKKIKDSEILLREAAN